MGVNRHFVWERSSNLVPRIYKLTEFRSRMEQNAQYVRHTVRSIAGYL